MIDMRGVPAGAIPGSNRNLSMFFGLWRGSGPGRTRTQMPTERRFVQEPRNSGPPGEPGGDRPWWKEMLGIGTKREWILVAVVLLLFAVYTYENEGARSALWAFTTAVSGLLIGRWWTKRNETESEPAREPVPGPGDTGPDEPGIRN